MKQKVVVLGLGHIGLPSAAWLASLGNDVVGVDTSLERLSDIRSEKTEYLEPALAKLVAHSFETKKLRLSLTPETADVYLIAVPTPLGENFSADLSSVHEAITSIAKHLQPGNLILLESTRPIGTTADLAERIISLRKDLSFEQAAMANTHPPLAIAYCPERVLPGQILQELTTVTRVVGGVNPLSTQRACAFYQQAYGVTCRGTTSQMAEAVKLAENSYRDINLAYANELSMICDPLDLDVSELVSLANQHPRVNILQPGVGVGGHCVAVDPWFLAAANPERALLIRKARQVNDSKPRFIVDKIAPHLQSKKNTVIAFLGMAFKPNISDLRESPALKIIQRIAREFPEKKLLICEPHISKLPPELMNLSAVEIATLPTVLQSADLICKLVDHDCFKDIPIRSNQNYLNFVR